MLVVRTCACYFSFVTADVRLIYVGRDNGRNSLNATVDLFGGPGREYITQHSRFVTHRVTRSSFSCSIPTDRKSGTER
jgi:hypothetical protein